MTETNESNGVIKESDNASAETKPADSQEEKKSAESLKPSARIGIDEKGFLTVQIHVSAGLWTIVGFLDEAKSWFKVWLTREHQKIQASKIVKPGSRWDFRPRKRR